MAWSPDSESSDASGPMSRVAWVFPGQGAQEVGMGRDVFDASPAARAVFERADQALGVQLSRLCFEGPDNDLRRTHNTQPAIVMVSIALLEAAREAGHSLLQQRPDFVAGHSLGEYSALIASGALSFEDGLRLVRERGRLMQAAGEQNPGTLAAILGLDEAAVREVCDATGAEVCNLNGGGQIVVGGTRPAVADAMALSTERGAKAIELNVSGAFHSSLMAPAVEGMRTAIGEATFHSPRVPVIANATATVLDTVQGVKDELVEQITTAVQWERTVQRMTEGGVTTIVEIGPGRVLSGMIKRIARGTKTANLNTASSLAAQGTAQ